MGVAVGEGLGVTVAVAVWVGVAVLGGVTLGEAVAVGVGTWVRGKLPPAVRIQNAAPMTAKSVTARNPTTGDRSFIGTDIPPSLCCSMVAVEGDWVNRRLWSIDLGVSYA